MKSNAPWSVKGIERDAREAAKEAARREGMTVGEWLNHMIYSHGQESASSGGEVEGLKLRDIITAIEHLRNRIVEAEKKNTEASSTLSRSVGGVVERLQRLERVKPAEGSYQDLAARLEKIESASGDRNRIDALKALEKAVSQVAVQFSSAQKTTLHRLDSAEQQLQEFAERIDNVGEGSEPADISSLKSAIEGLADRVARAEKVAHEAAALNDAAASSVDPEFVEQTGARLRVLGDEIKRGGDQIRAFENTIAKLADQIEAAEKRSSEGVQKVSDTIAEVREQVLAGVAAAEADKGGEVEALLANARQESEERIEALQRSFEEMKERIEHLKGAPQQSAAPVADAIAPEATDAEPEMAAPAETTEEEPSAQDDVDDIEDAVAALEAEEDPFAFADDDIEAEADDADGDEPVEDFSFQLDDDAEAEDDTQGAEASAEQVGDAQSRLSKVRSALSGEGFSEEAGQQNTADDEDDEINAILSDLDEAMPEPLGDEDDEDEQAAGTASLTPASDVEFESDDEIDEIGAAESEAEVPALESGEENSASPEPQEDYLASARRRAKEAAASRAEEAARPTRRNLTAKQRAILAARARQKKLEAEADDDEPLAIHGGEDHSPKPQQDDDADASDDEDASPGGRFAKITAALSSARSRIGRNRNKSAAGDEAPASIRADDAAAEAERKHNGDREALKTLQSTASARPLTLALGVAIILAIAALVFLVKDFVFKPDDGANPSASSPSQSEQPATAIDETAAAQTTQQDNLPAVPEAPAIDPEALYLEAMSDLNAAGDETAAIEAIGKLQDAAALGFPPAQLQLGELHKTGQGVEQDLGQARVWFRRAANGGNVLAMHRIGVMTARGDGGPADSAAAIAWFEQAANFGLVDSMYNLGAIYHPSENGSAIQDAEKAYYWYSLAARNGDEAAQPLAAGVASGLTAAERAAVDGRVAEWTAQDANPAANALSQG
jgi:localization factor PodJL